MKTNLDKFYKTEKSLEEDGVWFDIDSETGFLVRRIDQSKINKIVSLKYKKYARQFAMGTLNELIEKKILAEIFVDKFLVDWRGIEIDDSVVDFERDIAVKLFVERKDLFDALVSFASNIESFQEEVGN